jgi:DNA-directed RNA polymerase alpha subunit
MNNLPAFPNPHLRDDSGMTLRDYFAAKAMQKIMPESYVNQSAIDPIFLTPIDYLRLTARSLNCLKAESIFLIGDLVKRTQYELMKVPNLGNKTITEIKEGLSVHGLTLGQQISGWQNASDDDVATTAYKMADAMMKAREA